LLAKDLPHHPSIGLVRAVLVLAKLPVAAPVVEELSHRELVPGAGVGDGPAAEALQHRGLDALAGELAVHPRDVVVVLGLFLDVKADELQPAELRHEREAMAEEPGRGELAIGLALHELCKGGHVTSIDIYFFEVHVGSPILWRAEDPIPSR